MAKKTEQTKPAKKAAAKKPSHPYKINEQAWDKEIVMRILCNGIATSSRSITSILEAGHEGNTLPDYSTIMDWLAADEALADRYVKAKEAQVEFLADEMLDIADDGRNDWMARQGKNGEPDTFVVNGEHIQRSKLRIEARKWLMGKLKPKKYGDKIIQAGDPDNPVRTVQEVVYTVVDPKGVKE